MSEEIAPQIDFDEFLAVDMRVGRVTEVEDFPEARKPAWKLTIDFGPELGSRRSSAQIKNYEREQLAGAAGGGGGELPAAADRSRSSPRCWCWARWMSEKGVILLAPDEDVELGDRIG